MPRFPTFVAEPGLVLGEPLEPDPLADDVEELVEGGPALLVVVHLLLGLLAGAAVHHPHLGHKVSLLLKLAKLISQKARQKLEIKEEKN